MKDPFVGNAISSMKLLTMIDWVNESSEVVDGDIASIDGPIIALPPVQRSAVWHSKQVVDLWDSLFRGLPIGVLYLVKRAKGAQEFVTWRGQTVKKDLPGYDLLDGQQRIRALLLGAVGFSEEKRCLWVDLGDKDATRGFGLRITSKGQPFGHDAKTGTKLRLGERRAAREKLEKNGKVTCKGRKAYDHELFDEEVMQCGNRLCPQPPLPYGHSEHIFKLPDLLNAWRKRSSDCNCSKEHRVAALRTMVGNGPTQEALISLHEAFERINKAEVALLCVDPQSFRAGREDLLELFDRIGAGGTPLSVEERLYSIYKYRWPYIRDAVDTIHRQVGRVLSPTKIASTAIRIAYVQSAEPKEDRSNTPDVATFSKMLGDEREKGKRFRDWLNKLIPLGSQEVDGRGALLRGFQTIKNLLVYDQGVGHFWIPDVLLASLPVELWQVLTFWVVHSESVDANLSRQEAVRFALFWYLSVFNNEKAAGWAFAAIKESEKTSDFPGAAIYERFTGMGEDYCAYKLITPDEFTRKLCKEKSPAWSWKTDEERFGQGESRNMLGSHWWWNGKKMLPWLQKDYIRKTFQDYVPLTDHEDDVPYDFDHICPSKDWRDDKRNLRARLDIEESEKSKIYLCRDAVGNGLGNLQILSSSKNRQHQEEDLASKLPFSLNDSVPLTDIELEAMVDLTFNPEDRGLWKRVSKDDEVSKRLWNKDRLAAFQQAVEQRAAWLYRRFYDDLDYGCWNDRTTQ